jgi:hypothetical protein
MTESRQAPDTYTIYCDWCRDHNRTPPTREWWNKACEATTPIPITDILSDEQVRKLIFDDQADIDTERREGWAYD